MKCSIMQPHFLPWIGYFNLITQSEKFIFLDDAQFSKNNWHNRNRILNNNLPLWISVPIKSGNLKKKINETEIVSDDRWKKKMIRKIFSIYKKHPFINDLDLYSHILPRIIYYARFLIKNHSNDDSNMVLEACIQSITSETSLANLIKNYLFGLITR